MAAGIQCMSAFLTIAASARNVDVPVGVNSQANTQQFTMTVIQNANRNDCFLDL